MILMPKPYADAVTLEAYARRSVRGKHLNGGAWNNYKHIEPNGHWSVQKNKYDGTEKRRTKPPKNLNDMNEDRQYCFAYWNSVTLSWTPCMLGAAVVLRFPGTWLVLPSKFTVFAVLLSLVDPHKSTGQNPHPSLKTDVAKGNLCVFLPAADSVTFSDHI